MKTGILLVNLGSPDSPAVPDVRRYLREFLMDARVIDLPYPARWLVVNACILPFRPRRSAEAYRQVWLGAGSPLVVTSFRVQQALQDRVPWPVELAMRYQNPSIALALERLAESGVTDLVLLPLFPHYAMSSYQTAVERVRQVLGARFPKWTLKVVPPYYDHPAYISALADSAREFLESDFDHLLFSFHGVPERHLRKTDPTGNSCLATGTCCETARAAHPTCYRAQCLHTARAFVQQTGIPEDKYSISFQSRLGRDPWLQPFTDAELARLPARGARRLRVICPAFVTDCLETIEEIGIRGRKTFLQAGGLDFQLVPCLNDHPSWIAALEQLVAEQITAPFSLAMS